jgi:hypothetical protein
MRCEGSLDLTMLHGFVTRLLDEQLGVTQPLAAPPPKQPIRLTVSDNLPRRQFAEQA